jgi:D-alanyl-D-alanine carboxypeptidase
MTPPVLITGYDRDVVSIGIHKTKPDNKAWASAAYSAGGIASNTIDLVQFLKGLFAYKIIIKETIEKMAAFQNFIDEDIPEQTGYGMGLRRLVIENDTLIGHTGTIPIFGGAAFYCPKKDYYMAIYSNISYLKQLLLLRTVIRTIIE